MSKISVCNPEILNLCWKKKREYFLWSILVELFLLFCFLAFLGVPQLYGRKNVCLGIYYIYIYLIQLGYLSSCLPAEWNLSQQNFTKDWLWNNCLALKCPQSLIFRLFDLEDEAMGSWALHSNSRGCSLVFDSYSHLSINFSNDIFEPGSKFMCFEVHKVVLQFTNYILQFTVIS